jgi:hypothetical protein
MWRSTFGLLLVLLVAQAGLAEERFMLIRLSHLGGVAPKAINRL